LSHFAGGGESPVDIEQYLIKTNCDPQISKLIIFFSKKARIVGKGFFSQLLTDSNIGKTKNLFDEEQQGLDLFANDVFVKGLERERLARNVVTEELNQITEIEKSKNNFGIVIDPIDGSSLIDVNLTVGTIVGIYPDSVLEKGSRMIGSLYILYGPLITLTFTIGTGVHEFAMNSSGKFLLKRENIRIPEGKIYSPGALRTNYFAYHEKWIQTLEKEGYKLRFSGSFVADMNQILLKGGVFSYPGIHGREQGKLRLLFEANPMAKIIFDAGGAASNGRKNILDIKPSSITDTTSLYIGGKREISLIEALMTDQGY
jgi:fructose-1,6-bisphosphatase I